MRMTMVIRSVLFLFLFIVSLVRAETLSNGEDVDAYVRNHIKGSDVMVFAKSYCPHCMRTRKLLQLLHEENDAWSLDIVDLDLMEDGHLIQMELLTQTGQRTVPNVFVGGKHVGGNSDLQELHQQGKLTSMLSDIASGKPVMDEEM